MREANYRPVTATIHLDRLKSNIEVIKSHLPNNRAFFAVVKADGYGHGAVQIAKAAQQYGVDGFCVAMLDEALELRQAGITLPILVLGVTKAEQAQLMIDARISATVTSLEFLQEAETYITSGVLSVHLKIDTGMNRLGIQTLEALQLCQQWIEQSQKIQIEGVFTHFATADGEDDNRVHQQYKLFQQFVNRLTHRPKYIHLSNSAMSIWKEDYPSDIARIGIAMYGLNPSDVVLTVPYPLKPVLTWETEISFVHQVKKGESVSYGAKYIAKEDEWVATLPLGYADGWRRDLGRQSVYINGQACHIIGVVCMDQMMIKLPSYYPEGTPVELIGPNQSATDLAVNIGTIGYEILCGISPRVKRVYSVE